MAFLGVSFLIKIIMYKGEIKLSGKIYKVAVINGQRYIDDKPMEEFMKTLDPITINELAIVGEQAIIDEKKGTKNNSYQKMMDRFHITKSN
jgi:hypothetical protein